LNAVKAGQFEIKDEYQGSDIHTALMDINDIFRLANDESINIDVEDYIVNYDSIDELPTIEVEFSNLSKKSLLDGSGSFALLDTPGPNEAGQGDVLRNRLAEQIKRASMVLCVMDYTKLNCEEDDAIRKQIADMKAVFDKNIFIVVNKFDDNKSGSILDEDKTKDYVSDLIGESLNDGGFNRGCIFPVSSYLAFLSTRMKKQISSSVDLDDLIKNRDPKGWINDFLKEAFGLFDDDQEFCKDVLMSRCNKIIKKSQYENLVENMLMRAYGNSAYISLISALRKVKEFSEEVDIFLGIKVGGFSEKIERLEETIKKLKCLDEGVSKIKKEYNDVLLGFAECYEGEVEQLLS
jgi:hypothetical protein